MPNQIPPPDHWTLDKRVPVALIITLLVQGALGVWWLSKIDSRVDNLDVRLAREERMNERQDTVASDAVSRLIRVEERTGSILDVLRRLEQRIVGSPPGPNSHP